MSPGNILFPLAAMLSVTCLQTGCQALPARTPITNSNSLSTRNNAYRLLYQLLSEQKDVSLLRFIKSEPSDLDILVKRIATTSGTAAKLLEQFAQSDPSLPLDDLRLPPGELATRAAISSMEEKELLSQSGDEFELALLLTQTEALNYAWHLAKVTSENDPQPERARALAGIGEDMQKLYQEVFSLLLSKIHGPPTNSIPTHPA